jgi:hypothetical protein
MSLSCRRKVLLAIATLSGWVASGGLLWRLRARELADAADAARPQSNGEFIGRVVGEWLDDGRDMELKEDFVYIDPTGAPWLAPTGSIVNGASIPQVLWSLIGGPFEGRYRNASVIHDVACEAKNRPWQDVHRAFYFACLCGGVPQQRAAELYAAVLQGGPQWEIAKKEVTQAYTVVVAHTAATEIEVTDPVTGKKRKEMRYMTEPREEKRERVITMDVAVPVAVKSITEEDLKAISRFVTSANPSLSEIEAWVSARHGER